MSVPPAAPAAPAPGPGPGPRPTVCGYDVTVISGLQDGHKCPICWCVMREPMQTSCGHRFCRACIQHVYISNNVLTCPVDKQFSRVNQMYPDVAVQREIEDLKVRCSNHELGCAWTGDLRDLERHLPLCGRQEVACPACPARLARAELDAHVARCPERRLPCATCHAPVTARDMEVHQQECPRALVTCPLCGEAGLAREELADHQDAANGSCPKAEVPCPYSIFGCDYKTWRSSLAQHGTEAQQQHLALARDRLLRADRDLTQVRLEMTELKKELANLLPKLTSIETRQNSLHQAMSERNTSGRLHWRVRVLRRKGTYRSPAFYTGCPGYKIQMVLDVDGHREGGVRYSSLHLALLQGEYDDQLVFPFNAACCVVLYDQSAPGSRRTAAQHYTAGLMVREVPRVARPGLQHDRIYRRSLAMFKKRSELVGSGSRYCVRDDLHLEFAVEHCVHPALEAQPLTAGAPLVPHTQLLLPVPAMAALGGVASPLVAAPGHAHAHALAPGAPPSQPAHAAAAPALTFAALAALANGRG